MNTTTCTFAEANCLDFTPPARYFIRDALDNYVFFHTRNRTKAQEEADKIYGPKYKIQNSNFNK